MNESLSRVRFIGADPVMDTDPDVAIHEMMRRVEIHPRGTTDRNVGRGMR